MEERLPLPKSDPGERKREEKIETSGAGALAGMALGGTLGLIFGPVGISVGGMLGALAGNQIEYERIKSRKGEKSALF